MPATCSASAERETRRRLFFLAPYWGCGGATSSSYASQPSLYPAFPGWNARWLACGFRCPPGANPLFRVSFRCGEDGSHLRGDQAFVAGYGASHPRRRWRAPAPRWPWREAWREGPGERQPPTPTSSCLFLLLPQKSPSRRRMGRRRSPPTLPLHRDASGSGEAARRAGARGRRHGLSPNHEPDHRVLPTVKEGLVPSKRVCLVGGGVEHPRPFGAAMRISPASGRGNSLVYIGPSHGGAMYCNVSGGAPRPRPRARRRRGAQPGHWGAPPRIVPPHPFPMSDKTTSAGTVHEIFFQLLAWLRILGGQPQRSWKCLSPRRSSPSNQ